jgi:Ser/Thr protein kinase RdoA (MazF antagonist)
VLSTGDAAVVAADPAIPGLGTVLDPELLAVALRARLPDVAISESVAEYVRYKPGTSCLVRHRVTVGGEAVGVTAKAFAAEGAPKAEKLVRRSRHPSSLGPGGMLLPEHCAAVTIFPNDPALPALAALASPDTRPAVMRRVLVAEPQYAQATFTLISHRPERRFVARLDAGDAAVVVKGYNAAEFPAVRPATKAFSDGAALVPARLGASRRHRIVAFAWVPGDTLDVALDTGAVAPTRLGELGALLAGLHGRASRHLAPGDPGAEADRVRRAAEAVAVTVPQLAQRVRATAARVARDLGAAGAGVDAIHGDFAPDQVVVDDGFTIIDHDAAARGHGVTDIARFSAALTAAAVAGRLPSDIATAGAAALLEGYAAARPVAPELVALHRAAWVLRVAPEPFRHRHPRWVLETEQLVEAAAW